MSYDLPRLIEYHTAPEIHGSYYYGDVGRDTLEALTDLSVHAATVDMLPEVLAQLPEEGELGSIIALLASSLKMNKPDMISCVKLVIEELENKSYEFMQRAEHARDIVK